LGRGKLLHVTKNELKERRGRGDVEYCEAFSISRNGEEISLVTRDKSFATSTFASAGGDVSSSNIFSGEQKDGGGSDPGRKKKRWQ